MKCTITLNIITAFSGFDVVGTFVIMSVDIEVECGFCALHPETISHLFWSCEFTHKLWKDIASFINRNIFSDLTLHYKDVIFGCFDHKKKDNDTYFLINLILLFAKYHIHKCKFSSKTTNKQTNKLSAAYKTKKLWKPPTYALRLMSLTCNLACIYFIIYLFVFVSFFFI